MPATPHNHLVYIAESPIHGKGLFAARPLESGQFIGNYEGRPCEEDGRYVLWIEDDDGTGWNGYDGQNEMRYMNHADDPNAEMDGLDCYALKNIGSDEEITIDYGWNEEPDGC